MSCILLFPGLSMLQEAAPAVEPLWRIVLKDIPRDAAAVTVYVLLAASAWLIWWANRKAARGSGGSTPKLDRSSADTEPGDRAPVTPGGRNAPRRRGTRRAV